MIIEIESSVVENFFKKRKFVIEEYPCLNILNNLVQEGDFFYDKNGNIILEQDLKNGVVWVSWKHIWSFFSIKSDYNYANTQNIIKNRLEQLGICKATTPYCLAM